ESRSPWRYFSNGNQCHDRAGTDNVCVERTWSITSRLPSLAQFFTMKFLSTVFIGNLVGSDPSAGGIFTYTANGLTLSPSTDYFIVLTAATPVAEGAYDWSAANSFTESNQWQLNDAYFSSPDGSGWTGHARGDVFQLAINATVVPEPATLTLAGLGLACLCFWRRRQ